MIKSLNRYKDVNKVLHQQGLLFVTKITWIKFISRYYNNLLVRFFDINQTIELISQKYYWLSLKKNVETYVKSCNVCLAFKTVRYKFYDNLKALLALTYQYKDFLIDFITGLPILTNKKSENYNSILVIVNQLTKIIYYKLIKVRINVLELAGVIFNIVVKNYGLFNSIISNKSLLFIFKF